MEHQPDENLNKSKKNEDINPYMIPASIVLAGALIAGAVIYSNRPTGSAGIAVGRDGGAAAVEEVSGKNALDNIKPVTAADHIRGNPNAPVKIVEFSDLECPFCKRFHFTLQRIVKEYDGRVAWVYRHFPLDQLHSKARKEAQASECANELGGNEKFWAYLDRLFEVTPSNNGLPPASLGQIASDIGLDRAKFETCLSGDERGGKYADLIEANYKDAVASGGQGTPWSIVIAPNGKKFPINGAQSYETVKSSIELALNEK